jgi:phage protein D
MPNVSPNPAKARQPRGAVKLNGEMVPGWISFEVENNATRSADTFRIVCAVSQLSAKHNAAWFSAQKSLMVEIFAGFPADPQHFTPADLDCLIVGHADEVDFDLVESTIELCGRDLTALLIDTKTSEHFKEKKSSDVAMLLAQRRKLTPVVTPTRNVIGKYYKYDRVTLAQEQSEWEILSYLANVEDFQVYVKGQALHFEPRPEKQTDPYLMTWKAAGIERGFPVANVIRLQCTRNLTIAKGVSVEVRSWNVGKGGQPVVATFPKAAKATAPGQASARTQVYHRFFPHLTHAEAQQRAQNIYRQIIAHEMRMEACLPADNRLDCTKTLQVCGTGTKFDQLYYPESVTRTLSMDEGYRMEIRAKNTSPEREALP